MMTWKKYIPLTLAVAFAILSSASVYQFLKNQSDVSHAMPALTVPVVVAKTPLGIGEKITENDLSLISLPTQTVSEDGYRSIHQVVGRTVKTNMKEREPIVEDKLLAQGENFSSLVPPGMMAVTVPIRNSEALAQILERGTVVDVLSLFQFEDTKIVTAETIVPKAHVIGVHKNSAQAISKGRGQEGAGTMEVTLVVTSLEAKRIVGVMSQGIIELVVRSNQAELAGK